MKVNRFLFLLLALFSFSWLQAGVVTEQQDNFDQGAYIGVQTANDNEGNVFTATSSEGQEITFMITSDEDGNRTCVVGDGRDRAIDYNYEGALTIPSQVSYDNKTYDVIAISQEAFSGILVTSVNLPATLKMLNSWSFAYCNNLASLVIPSNVTEIGEGAIVGCSNLLSLTVESGNTKYTSVNNAIIEGGTKIVLGCNGTSIPNTVTEIGIGAFEDLQNMTLTIPQTVTKIGERAFQDCYNCVFTVEYATPLEISYDTFNGAGNNHCILRVPTGTKSAYQNAEGWSSFGNNIMEGDEGTEFYARVGGNEFDMLFTITGENTVKVGSINDKQAVDPILFNGDYYNGNYIQPTQTAIIIPETVVYNSKTYTVTEIGDYAFGWITFTTISLPSTIKKIGTWVFVDNWKVQKLTIPKSVTEISEGMIINCANLTSLTIENGNGKYTSPNNNVIIENGTKIIAGIRTATISNDITVIGAKAFWGTSDMKLTIPQTVTTIGERAFAYCQNCVFTVDNNTPLEIDDYTFDSGGRYGCVLKVPAGAKSSYQAAQGWSAFGDNIMEGDEGTEFYARVGSNEFDMMFTITGSNTVKVGSLIGNGNSPAVDRVLFNGNYDNNGNYTPPTQTAIVVPEIVEYKGKSYNVTEIGNYAFCNVNFKTIDLPSMLVNIGARAFESINDMAMTIPPTVTTFGENAFAWCHNCVFTVEYETPIEINEYTFDGTSDNSVLRVPTGAKPAYQAASGWSAFGNNIMEGDEGIEFQENVDNGLSMWFTVTGENEVKAGRLAGGLAVDYNLYRGINGSAPERTSITIPETVTHEGTTYTVTAIGDYAFSDLEQLIMVEIPATITSIGENAFCSWSLTKVILKAETPLALTNQNPFTEYTQEEGILYVQNKADIETYKTNWGVNHVFVTGGIEFMNGTLAEICINNWGGEDGILTEAEAKAVTSDMMFPAGNSPFTQNYIPSFDELQYFGLTSIPEGAFQGCGMRSVKIPEGVTTIGNWAFNSNNLESIDFPNSLIKMGRGVIAYNENLSTITGGNQIVTAENGLYYGQITESWGSEEVTIPSLIRVGVNTSGIVAVKEGTEMIEEGAFRNCRNVTGITIPKSLNNIAGDLDGCSLATIEVAEGNQYYMADNNVLYATWGSNTPQQLIICGCQNTGVVTIPESVNGINGRAFYGCSNVSSVILPSSLNQIGYNAFEGCTSLTEITLGANVINLQSYVFLNCKNLKNVYSRIKNVADVYLDENAFMDRDESWNYTKRDATLWVPTGYVDLYIQYGWNNYFTAIQEDASLGELIVGDEFVFQDDDNSPKFRYKITSIGETVNTCEVYRGNHESAIEEYPESFDNNLIIPQEVEDDTGKKYQVTGIGAYALQYCDLTSVTLPSGLAYIDEGALADNWDLTSIELPASLTRIGNWALYNGNLMLVTANMEIPAKIEGNSFSENTYNQGTLMVPVGTKNAYMSNEDGNYWKQFNNIYSGNEGTEFDAVAEGNDFKMRFTTTGSNTVKVGYKSPNRDTPAVDRALFEYNYENDTPPSQTAIVVPETVEYNGQSYTVTEIGDFAFHDVQFKTITLPSTLLKIGREAITNNWEFQELTIPNSVTEISKSAIYNCGNLTSLKVEAGDNTKYTSPNNNVIIENGTKIVIGTKTTTIPDAVTEIGAYAFRDIRNMSLTIPQSVTSIGEFAFAWCNNCVFTVESETPIEINENTFQSASDYNCILRVPSGKKQVYLEALGWSAFGDNIMEGDEGTEFQEEVDNGLPMWFTITGKNKVKVGHLIGNQGPAIDDAPFNTWGLDGELERTSVTIPKTVIHEGTTYKITAIGERAFSNIGMESVTLPNTIREIGSYSFSDCYNLKAFVVPASVTSIREFAFANCGSITSVKVASANEVYESPAGSNAIIEKASKTLICGFKNTVIPDNVTKIGPNSFRYNEDLKVTIPKSVKEIDYNAFTDCWGESVVTVEYTDLSEVTLGNDVFIGSTQNGMILIVPQGMKSTYLETEGWNMFPEENIREADLDGFVLNKTKLGIAKGETEVLTATCPPTWTDKRVTWESSDTKIARVSNDGEVKGVRTGTAMITCTSVETGAKVTCLVTVGYVQFSESEVTILKGEKVTLQPTVYPSTLEDQSMTWKSSNTKIVKVSNDGEVTGVRTGTATITCISNATGATATCEVTVGYVLLSESEMKVQKGEKVTLRATIYPTTLEDQSVIWESSNTKIATVSADGEVKGVRTGTATITCISNATGLTATCEVIVGYVQLSDSEVTILKGEKVTLQPTVYPSKLEDQSVTWKSSNTKIAKVSSTGEVTGVRTGTATITCTSVATGLSATCEVTVGYVQLSKSEVSIQEGKTLTLKATVYPTTLEDQSVTWKSSNSKIVKVNESTGKIKGINAGTATITCTSVATGITATCEVTVTAAAGARSLVGGDDEATDIDVESIVAETFDVYDLNGRKVLHQATSLDALPKGVYIVNGRKVFKRD